MEGQFHREAGESRTRIRAIEAAVNDGLKMQADTDEKQLFVCEITDRNVEEEYAEEISECAEQ